MSIKYLVGDALIPVEVEGIKVIAHVCNDKRVMGAGIALAIARKWPHVEDRYLKDPNSSVSGTVQLVQVSEDTYVLNMIAQTLLSPAQWKSGQIPLNYDSLSACLNQAETICNALGATLVGPKFGSELAGGDWIKIEGIIAAEGFDKGVVIYTLPGKK